MLATLSDSIPMDSGWVLEKKYDGYRVIAKVSNGKVDLISRNGISFVKQFPSIVGALRNIDMEVVLDGEVVVEDILGRHAFSLLKKGEPLPRKYRLTYYVFDLLALDGHDLRGFELFQRKELLKLFLEKIKLPNLVYSAEVNGAAEEVVKNAEELGWEGVIAKKMDSRYLSGKRTSFWRKIKFSRSQEAIVVGYTKSEKTRGSFGALVLAVQGKTGLEYIGNCGSGFTELDLKDMYAVLRHLHKAEKPFSNSVVVANEKCVNWVKPKLIVEVVFSEWTPEGRMRHPVFKGIREDKPLEDVVKEEFREM